MTDIRLHTHRLNAMLRRYPILDRFAPIIVLVGVFFALQGVAFFFDFVSMLGVNIIGNKVAVLAERAFWTLAFFLPGAFMVVGWWQPALAAVNNIGTAAASKPVAGGVSLADLRERSVVVTCEAQPDLSKAHVVMHNVAATPQKGVLAQLMAAGTIGAAGIMSMSNHTVRALAFSETALSMWVHPSKLTEKEAWRQIDEGSVSLVLQWETPLVEIPDVIEIGSGVDHVPNLPHEYAQRFEDVFFMHRGRRMILARYYGQVRDTVTVAQFRIREMIEAAKDRVRAQAAQLQSTAHTDEGRDATAERHPPKGLDL